MSSLHLSATVIAPQFRVVPNAESLNLGERGKLRACRLMSFALFKDGPNLTTAKTLGLTPTNPGQET
eukprot:1496997-Amphidinium_carterae.1